MPRDQSADRPEAPTVPKIRDVVGKVPINFISELWTIPQSQNRILNLILVITHRLYKEFSGPFIQYIPTQGLLTY